VESQKMKLRISMGTLWNSSNEHKRRRERRQSTALRILRMGL
jgi:hypothetical protein